MEAVNTSKKDVSADAILSQIEHTFQNGKAHFQKVKDWMGGKINGINVLELGPGPDFGSVMVLASLGANVSVSDRWLPSWEDDYHIPLYLGLMERIKADFSQSDTSLISNIIDAKFHDPALIPQYKDAEFLDSELEDEYDLIISNAVYEHIVDIELASKNVFRATKKGGKNVHQVDFRDHRNFDFPLEFLLMTSEAQTEWLKETEHHLGCQRRRNDYEKAFEDAGFRFDSKYVTLQVESSYFEQFLPKLRAVVGAEHQSTPVEQLVDLGICYVLTKH